MRSAPRIRCLSIVLCLFWSLPVLALIQVNESEMRATISQKEIALHFPVLNDSKQAISGTLSVDLLDPKDNVVIASQAAEELKPGRNTISLNLVRPGDSGSLDNEPLLWYRVRYQLHVEGRTNTAGIIALGAITPQMFELVAAHPENALPDQPYRIRVHTANPVTRTPVARVEVSGEMKWDLPRQGQVVRKTTNAAGDADLIFHIPAGVTTGATLKITAANQEQRREVSFGFDIDTRTKIIISTDKPLYQPGQSLHARALVLGTDRHAVAGANVNFRLLDPDDGTVFTGTKKTDDFGIANIDWDLPEFLSLGPYALEVSLAGSETGFKARTEVRVSRYDLPNFTVTVTADRHYYLPGETAAVEVSAKYLFGKDLTAGTVKLVREEEGQWDSK
jgi:hypothetical protein